MTLFREKKSGLASLPAPFVVSTSLNVNNRGRSSSQTRATSTRSARSGFNAQLSSAKEIVVEVHQACEESRVHEKCEKPLGAPRVLTQRDNQECEEAQVHQRCEKLLGAPCVLTERDKCLEGIIPFA